MKAEKQSIALTVAEIEHLRYALRSVWVTAADKDSMLPEDYRERTALQRSLARKLGVK